MACNLVLKGNLTVGSTNGSSCGGCGTGTQKIQPLSFACPSAVYEKIVSTDCPVTVSSPTAFIPIPGGSLSQYQFLYLKTSQAMTMRINASGANVTGSGGTFPTGFAGGETFSFSFQNRQTDGSFATDFTVAVTFTAAAQSAQDVVNEINATAVGNGNPVVASVDTSGQITITDPSQGPDRRWLNVTPNATIGFGASIAETIGTGQEMPISGTFMAEYGAASTITSVEIQGTGTVEVLAAGAA